MTVKEPRLVDPVHFFNAEGVSLLSLKHLMKVNESLEKDNERLLRLLRAQVERNRVGSSETETSTN